MFPTGEYEQHKIHHPNVPWPFTMRIEERIGKRIQEMTSMFDPYQMIDMFRCNSLGHIHSHRFDTTTGERIYCFKPTRRYNRILIEGPDGNIKKSYDLVQKNSCQQRNNVPLSAPSLSPPLSPPILYPLTHVGTLFQCYQVLESKGSSAPRIVLAASIKTGSLSTLRAARLTAERST